jgi:uncharacterized damage-inducible protein DinB
MSAELVELLRANLVTQMETLLAGVKEQAEPLTNEQFWTRPIEPSNSIGHLVLHLTGNLKHFTGALLLRTGYVRNRDKEFTDTTPPTKTVALAALDEAVAQYIKAVQTTSPEALLTGHPEARFGTILNAFLTLLTHFAVHRGQISYIRRLVEQGHKAPPLTTLT